MTLSQNTLQRRKSIRDANANKSVFRAGNIPARKPADGGRITPSTAAHMTLQARNDELAHKVELEQAKQGAVDDGRQSVDGQTSMGAAEYAADHDADHAAEHDAETAVDSPFSQMSITGQVREPQPPPAANMVRSLQSTQEPGEIRESPGARRRGKQPVRDSSDPTAWPPVPQFGGIHDKVLLRSDVRPDNVLLRSDVRPDNVLLRSDVRSNNVLLRSNVVSESPLFVTPNETPPSSAMSSESMEVMNYMRMVERVEARRDAEDGTYEPSQADTPADLINAAAAEELAQDAEILSRNPGFEESRRRKSAMTETAETVAGSASADVDTDSDCEFSSAPMAGRSAAAKRRSPELHDGTPLKRRKQYEKEDGLLKTWSYESLTQDGKDKRDKLLADIHRLWGVHCHEAIPQSLWLQTSKGRCMQPRDWARPTLIRLNYLAVLTQSDPDRAVKALRQAISERTQTVPNIPARIHVERDIARAIEIVETRPVPRSPTVGRTEATEVDEETLADVLRRTTETPQRGFSEPARADSTGPVTVAKVESPPISPSLSGMPVKIESSPAIAAAAHSLLREPKSRLEVMQMDLREFEDFYEKSEQRFDHAKAECSKRLRETRSASTELSVLNDDQLEEYRKTAKADWELAQTEWRRRVDERKRRQQAEAMANAIVVD